MYPAIRFLICVQLAFLACASDTVLAEMEATVTLRSPLTTVVGIRSDEVRGLARIVAEVVVPADAPADLGVGAFAAEFDGTWFQRLHDRPLTPGRHRLSFAFAAVARIANEPEHNAWSRLVADNCRHAGIFFWSSSGSRCRIDVTHLDVLAPASLPQSAPGILADLDMPGHDASTGTCTATTGRRWRLRFRPDPLPVNPFDPACFAADLSITRPDGKEERIPASYIIPYRLRDRGDSETAAATAPGRFEIRYRPRLPGRHRLRLICRWQQGTAAAYPHLDDEEASDPLVRTHPLPDLIVEGEPWDDYVRIDAQDPRFFSHRVDGTDRFYWPVGINMRSVNDPRGAERTGSKLTSPRGWHAYRAYLRRFAATGGNAIEIWMSSWNLALEWRDDWPGFYGLGRYNLANAARLDRILDLAHELGIRINLVVYNHGMASNRCDREWHNNPHNLELGGPVDGPQAFFTHPQALRSQDRLRRYLVARYADHPAVLGWKLWTEINLTAGQGEEVVDWHRQACRRWHELDVYDHGCTTHWAGDYRTPDRRIVFLPELDYVCIDAYHGEDRLLAHVLWNSTNHREHGLANLRHPLNTAGRYKPILVTEYGGNWNAAPRPRLLAEHQTGAWVGLVSGHAGTPMLWWFEWVDQNQLWAPYRSITRFLSGEDLRSGEAGECRPARLSVEPTTVWAGVWARPGRILGYLQDRRWSTDGREARELADVTVHVTSGSIDGGPMWVEWWDPDLGQAVARQAFRHAGGRLSIEPPPFRRHLAFKLWRDRGEDGTTDHHRSTDHRLTVREDE